VNKETSVKRYKIIYDHEDRDTEQQLNELADDGWRLHSVIPGFSKGNPDGYWFVMELDVPEASNKGSP
jgi:hypothetical protein